MSPKREEFDSDRPKQSVEPTDEPTSLTFDGSESLSFVTSIDAPVEPVYTLDDAEQKQLERERVARQVFDIALGKKEVNGDPGSDIHMQVYPLQPTLPSTVESEASLLESVVPIQEALSAENSRISLEEVTELVREFRSKVASRLMGVAMRGGIPEPLYWEHFQAVRAEMFPKPEIQGADNISHQYATQFMTGRPLLEVTKQMVADGMDSRAYVDMFLQAADARRAEIMNAKTSAGVLADKNNPVARYAMQTMSGTTPSPENKNADFLYRNQAHNFLRLIGIFNPVTYDKLHRNGFYRFTDGVDPNPFAGEVISYGNEDGNVLAEQQNSLVLGKRMLTIGPGNGPDEVAFLRAGAASVDMIEGSAFMLSKLRELKARLATEGLSEKLHVPDEPQDMLRQLQHMRDEGGPTYDTVYSHSVFHYLDDRWTAELLKLIHERLNQGGHLAFAVKAPGAVLDGDDSGMKIIDQRDRIVPAEAEGDAAEEPAEVQELIRCRMILNFDAQFRVFRDPEAWEKLLRGSGFKPIRITKQVVSNYETIDQPDQTFLQFICKRLVDGSNVIK